jgi:methylenetetrahydrofolate reductase (NADPH)
MPCLLVHVACFGSGQASLTNRMIHVFLGHVQGKIAVLPWTELEGLMGETSSISTQLTALNKAGYLTINSQPAVNGTPSSDPKHGWGGPGG